MTVKRRHGFDLSGPGLNSDLALSPVVSPLGLLGEYPRERDLQSAGTDPRTRNGDNHIRYLAALTDATQAELVDRVGSEFAPRDADDIRKGMDRAAEAMTAGDAAIAALVRGDLTEAVERVSGLRPKSD
jgi:hypothetical protein